jgi:hypothetical protein
MTSISMVLINRKQPDYVLDILFLVVGWYNYKTVEHEIKIYIKSIHFIAEKKEAKKICFV